MTPTTAAATVRTTAEVEQMLRDVAFVLKLARQTSREIRREAAHPARRTSRPQAERLPAAAAV